MCVLSRRVVADCVGSGYRVVEDGGRWKVRKKRRECGKWKPLGIVLEAARW